MKSTIIKTLLLCTTVLGTTTIANAEDVTLTIESWRNDDLSIWQDKIIPAFEAQNPGIKVKFTPSAPAEYNAVLNSKLDAGSAGDLITCRPFDASLSIYDKGQLASLADLEGMKNFSDVAKSAWNAEKANFLPKLNLGYALQSVDGQSGFYSWEAGISVPLFFFSQAGKTKAAKLDFQIAGQELNQKKLELMAQYNQLLNRILVLENVIDYYIIEALPLAEEQIQASNLAYRLGSIDYVQFIQNIESAINTKQAFLNQEAEYYELSAELKFITGK